MPSEISANLKPTMLDRLVDVSLNGSAASHWYSPDQIMEAVRRDLEALLNTRQTSQGLCDGFPEVENSLITYGIPDASSLKVVTAQQRAEVARRIEESIRRFEPRLERVKVEIMQPATRKDRVLRMQVSGRLTVEPVTDIEFDGSMEVTTGQVSMAISS